MSAEQRALVEILKEATQGRHASVEEAPFVAALVRGDLPLGAYLAQLRAMSVVHQAFEAEWARCGDPALAHLLDLRPSRVEHLRLDLEAFGEAPECPPAMEAARQAAGWIRQARLDGPEAFAGIVYVMEGTSFGNAVHHADVVRTFSHEVRGATRYYAGYGSETAARWREFRAVLGGLPQGQEAREAATRSALTLFERLEELFRALHP